MLNRLLNFMSCVLLLPQACLGLLAYIFNNKYIDDRSRQINSWYFANIQLINLGLIYLYGFPRLRVVFSIMLAQHFFSKLINETYKDFFNNAIYSALIIPFRAIQYLKCVFDFVKTIYPELRKYDSARYRLASLGIALKTYICLSLPLQIPSLNLYKFISDIDKYPSCLKTKILLFNFVRFNTHNYVNLLDQFEDNYRRISLKNYPDNKDFPQARAIFEKIIENYEVESLKNILLHADIINSIFKNKDEMALEVLFKLSDKMIVDFFLDSKIFENLVSKNENWRKKELISRLTSTDEGKELVKNALDKAFQEKDKDLINKILTNVDDPTVKNPYKEKIEREEARKKAYEEEKLKNSMKDYINKSLPHCSPCGGRYKVLSASQSYYNKNLFEYINNHIKPRSEFSSCDYAFIYTSLRDLAKNRALLKQFCIDSPLLITVIIAQKMTNVQRLLPLIMNSFSEDEYYNILVSCKFNPINFCATYPEYSKSINDLLALKKDLLTKILDLYKPYGGLMNIARSASNQYVVEFLDKIQNPNRVPINNSDPLNTALRNLGFNYLPTLKEAKIAYHKLAKATHPDRNPGVNEDVFKTISNSYSYITEHANRLAH